MIKFVSPIIATAALGLSACGGGDSSGEAGLTDLALDPTTTVVPTSPVSPTESSVVTAMEYGSSEAWGTVLEVVYDSEGLAIFVEALEATDLVSALEADGPITLFAPTDQAFNSLPDGVLAKLLLPENREKLIQVLEYHLVPQAFRTTDFAAGSAATVEGEPIRVVPSPSFTVNDGTIRIADIAATNGVVHIVETVLLPPDLDINSL
ncbi:MAG: fasciclin domain-containing protein [Ilumatobacteraceae bacterium]